MPGRRLRRLADPFPVRAPAGRLGQYHYTGCFRHGLGAFLRPHRQELPRLYKRFRSARQLVALVIVRFR